MKEEKEALASKNTEDCKKGLWTNKCQQVGQPAWNGYIPRDIQAYQSERIRTHE